MISTSIKNYQLSGPMNLRMEVSMLGNGRVVNATERENKYGQMALFMKDIGKIMWLQGRDV